MDVHTWSVGDRLETKRGAEVWPDCASGPARLGFRGKTGAEVAGNQRIKDCVRRVSMGIQKHSIRLLKPSPVWTNCLLAQERLFRCRLSLPLAPSHATAGLCHIQQTASRQTARSVGNVDPHRLTRTEMRKRHGTAPAGLPFRGRYGPRFSPPRIPSLGPRPPLPRATVPV